MVTNWPWPADEPWRDRRAIWKWDLHVREEGVNLSESARLEGINCKPVWSPDGRWIAFVHCDPVKGERPCETGLDIWVMAADGTEPVPVARSEAEVAPFFQWSVNGDRLIYGYGYGTAVSRDLDGTDRQELPVRSGNMSPDGLKIAYDWIEPDIVDGEPGVWRQLILADPDGSGERTLVQHFVRDSDVVEHLSRWAEEPEDPHWMTDVRHWVGPRLVTWSPKGDRVAFMGALPSFDPQGAYYKFQQEPWIYELATGILTRLTADDPTEIDLIVSWRHPNTYPEDPRVTVGDTTIMFSEVTGEGLTTVIRDDDRPAEPGGYRFGGYYYYIRTTAQHKGPVRIAVKYADEDVAGGNEEALAILRYDEAEGEWEDVTTSRDVKENIVYGEVDSL